MNMTTLNFALSRAAGRDFAPGDEILTTALDHDGGVAPWVELAADKGLTVRVVDATDDLTVDYDDLERKLSERTRVVAFALASNATGSLADARRICRSPARRARSRGSTPSTTPRTSAIDVAAIGCDVLLCSPYKFCGPHLGMAYVREALGETWRAYKARPSPSTPVGRRFETGTLPYELLAGFRATIAYLDSLGGMDVLRDYERDLGERFLAGLPPGVVLYGPAGMDGRVPTFLLNVDGVAGRGRRPRARRARHRRLVRRQLVLRRPRRPPARAVAPRRADPLQHGGRGRPAARRARRPCRRRVAAAVRKSLERTRRITGIDREA